MVLATSDFVFPPTDGSVSPGLVIDFHLKHNPKYVFAVLYDVKSLSQTNVTYEQLAHAVHRVAHLLNPGASIPQGTNVGILVSTDTIVYIMLVLGAMRAGLVPFPISPRTPVAGIAHLCTETKTSRVLAGGSPAILELCKNLKSSLNENQQALDYIQLPSLGDIFPDLSQSKTNHDANYEPFPDLDPTGDESIVNVLHSSGSTGMPRPISLHQEGVFKNVINQPLVWMYGKPGTRVGTMALPTFHTMGMMMQCLSPLYIGYTQVLFAPSHTPVVPTSNLTIQAVADTDCEFLMSVPAFLEIWSQDEDAIAQLKKMTCVSFGGGPLAEHVGDHLINEGVHIHSGYGATEFGAVNNPYDPDRDPNDWLYVSFSPRANVRFAPQNDDEESYELVLLSGAEHKPFVLNSEYEGEPAYRTKDLVVPHPSKPDLWKFVGRLDDQIILLNGEKTNPGPMEAEILESPVVQFVAMFGRERNQTGVLVELADNVKDKYRGKENRAELVEQIWPYVERANQASPSHSRLAMDAIILVDPSRPLPRTPKGTVSRSAALKAYANEIDEMYAALEKDTDVAGAVGSPESWTEQSTVERWVEKCVESILGREIEVGGDLFQQGMDSLTATILLRSLKGVLHSSDDDTVKAASEKISQQTIFAKPTVEQLSGLLVQLCTNGESSSPADVRAIALEAIHAMIQKYDSNWGEKQRKIAVRAVPSKERVVVTGTTGALGSYLLALLLERDDVEKVWALNRKSRERAVESVERQRASFEDKALDAELLEGGKLVLLEADLEDEKLGLEAGVYEEIRGTATAIIHNAWQVNFNLSLQSFDPSIKGARNLLDLAFGSTAPTGLPRFLFTSSISAAGFGKPGRHLKEAYLEPEDAADGIGYGQSKLVTEKLLESARKAGLETCVVRLGQLTGDDMSGSWSITDWVPSMIASSVSAGALPSAVGNVSWFPLNIAAQSILDVSTAHGDLMPTVIHSSHPHPVEWSHIMTIFANTLKTRTKDSQPLPIVPFDEWNERVSSAASALKGSESDRYKHFPSTKIQSTFEGMVRANKELQSKSQNADVEAGGTARLDTAEAEKLSAALRDAPRLEREHVEKWVGYWEKKGMFV